MSHHQDWSLQFPAIRRMLVNGRTREEIASVLGTSVSTIQKLIRENKLRDPVEARIMPPGFAKNSMNNLYTAKPKSKE